MKSLMAFLAASLAAMAFLSCSLVATAAEPQAPSWAVVQESANAAFAVYDKERAATDVQKIELLKKRFKAFSIAAQHVSWFIRENFESDVRNSGLYAYKLFTLAHYTELSGDLWRARDLYVQVLTLIELALIPAGATIPTYNDVSLLRLCIRQTSRLQSVLSVLGPRPTVVSILQNVEKPTTDDFAERILQRDSQFEGQVLGAVLARDNEPEYAYMAASEAVSAEQGNKAKLAEILPQVIVRLAKQQGVEALLERQAHITVVSLGLDQNATKAIVGSFAQITDAYKRVLPGEVFRPGPSTVVVTHAVEAEKWRFLSAALNEGNPVPAGGYYALQRLDAVLIPSGPVEGHDIEAIDALLLYTSRLRRSMEPLPDWLDPAMLSHDGAMPYTLADLDALVTGMRASGMDLPEVPLYECPRTRVAIRFCALHVGAFARYLDSLPDPNDPKRTLLQALAARVPELVGKSLTEQSDILQNLSGMTRESMAQTFAAYRRTAPWARGLAAAAVAAMVPTLVRDFKASR
jgi:hypothetical protein